MNLLISLLAFVLVAFVAGNGLTVAVGSLISGRIVRFRTGILIAILGYSLGFLVQGGFLSFGYSAILPMTSYGIIVIALSIAIFVFLVAHVTRVAASLSITFAMALLGLSVASGEHANMAFVLIMFLVWILAPLISLYVAALGMRRLHKHIARRSIWSTVSSIRILLIALCFLTAFTAGANVMGLIFASVKEYTSVLVIIAGIIVGSALMGRGELRRIGNEIIPIRYLNALTAQLISVVFAEFATLASIPLANSQTFTAGIIGSGLGYKTRLLLKKPLLMIVSTWIFSAVASFALGFILAPLVPML